MREKFRRILAISILIILFAGMIVHYSGTAPQNDTVMQSYEKLDNSGKHIGDTVYFWSGVAEVSSNQVTLGDLNVVNVTKTVQPGDGVQVYGTIQSEGKVVAERVIVTENEDRTQLYIISVIGTLLAIAFFFKSWTVNIRTLNFVPRESQEDA